MATDRALLLQLFTQERDRMALAYPALRRATVSTACVWARDSTRDYAMADRQFMLVYFHPAVLHELNVPQLRGIIRHELGHLADAHYDEDPGSERRADDLARRAGCPVRYGPDDVQTAGAGKARRPKHLHQ